MRHFKAKQMVGRRSTLGESFAELRYHLVQSGREAELGVVGQRFTDHLKREIKSVSPVPTDSEELDERIAVLTVLLGKEGAKGLEYHLAQCLQSRAKPGDLAQAISHGTRAIDRRIAASWVLVAGLMAKANRLDDAIALLEKGISVVPASQNLFSLYQGLSEMHCRIGNVAAAIAMLRRGFGRMPALSNGHKLTEAALYLCAAAEAPSTLAEILNGTGSDTVGPAQAALGEVLQMQMRDDWKGASEVAKAARQSFPRYFPLAAVESYSRLASGDVDEAGHALSSFPDLQFAAGAPHAWLAALIDLRRGARSEACEVLATYLGRPIDERRELNEAFLLRLWDQTEMAAESHRLSFHFPIMPTSLTGLSQAVHRVQFGNPVLNVMPAHGRVPQVPMLPATSTAPEVYVSYAWGEDSSEAGQQREDIVDRLCEAVQRSGRAIGRDKERVRGGDSIERFAQEISKAERIVAVISERSLRSEFCMAHELFRAFRRCDYQRAEFQEKVIAVVMDDAKPLLKDNVALVALAKTWQERVEELRAELQAVDPTRKSPTLWIFVDLMEDMCPRLPDMLGALKDIVMKRGFDAIVADGFKEVLDRLPAV